jgi:hypothetical protein
MRVETWQEMAKKDFTTPISISLLFGHPILYLIGPAKSRKYYWTLPGSSELTGKI